MKIKTIINELLKQVKYNQRIKQVAGLFTVNIIGIPIGIITSIVITRYLGVQGYGDFKFIYSIFSISIVVFTFGFFQAGNRALVLNNDKQKAKEYFGAELVITGGIFIVMAICLTLYALFDKNIHEKQLSTFLLSLIPLGWVFLLPSYFETLLQADNRIRLLAQVRLYPTLGFLFTASLVYFIFMEKQINKLAVIWFFNLTTQILVYLYVIIKLQVSFQNIKIRLKEIWFYNKTYGLNIYLGSLFILGFSLSELLISYFGVNNSGVGLYSLALTFSTPLTFIPNTIATTHYKDFSKVERIPRKLFLVTVALSISAMIGLWIMVNPLIRFFYGKEFLSVINLNFIVSFGVLAHGLADFFNRFLGANGQGKALRNSAFIVGASIFLLNLLFIPKWGEYGASYAKLISGFIYLICMYLFYVKYINNKKQGSLVKNNTFNENIE